MEGPAKMEKSARMGVFAVALLLIACVSDSTSAVGRRPVQAAALQLDHVWIAVRKGGPERQLLEDAGFIFAPTINEHEGQGTASATIEFENGFLELIWADDGVAAWGPSAIAKDRFTSRANWNVSGDSPFGIGFRRTALTPRAFPFPTFKVQSAWMGAGETLEILSPRGSKTVTLSISPHEIDEAANLALIRDGKGQHFKHPIGARRLTGVTISAPRAEALPPSADYVGRTGAARFKVGAYWLMALELDHGRQNRRLDLRPGIPLTINY